MKSILINHSELLNIVTRSKKVDTVNAPSASLEGELWTLFQSLADTPHHTTIQMDNITPE